MFTARWFIALTLLCVVSGCGLMQPAREVAGGMKKSMKVSSGDYRAPEEESEWAGVGSEARGNQKRTKDNDFFWHLYDPRTREITRNLGYEN